MKLSATVKGAVADAKAKSRKKKPLLASRQSLRLW